MIWLLIFTVPPCQATVKPLSQQAPIAPLAARLVDRSQVELLLALVCLGLILLFWWLMRKKAARPPSPHQQAMTSLAALTPCPTPGKEEAEALATLLRNYIDRCCDLPTSIQIGAEASNFLANTRLSKNDQQDILTILKQCEEWLSQSGTIDQQHFAKLISQSKGLLALAPGAKDDKTCGRW